MNSTALDVQQARIKQILFKSQLRSVLYGVREPSQALFSPQENVLSQWLTTVMRPQYGTRPEVREAERLLSRMLDAGRELVAQYQRGQIEESRRGLSQIDACAELFMAQLQRLVTAA